MRRALSLLHTRFEVARPTAMLAPCPTKPACIADRYPELSHAKPPPLLIIQLLEKKKEDMYMFLLVICTRWILFDLLEVSLYATGLI